MKGFARHEQSLIVTQGSLIRPRLSGMRGEHCTRSNALLSSIEATSEHMECASTLTDHGPKTPDPSTCVLSNAG